MARSAHNDVLDALLDEIATATSMCVCSAAPSTHAEAATTYMLAATPIAGGDFTNAEGSLGTAGGRKVTVTAQADNPISNSGTANHIALIDANDVLFVTTATAQALTAGGTVTVPAFIIEVEDPVAP